MLISTRKRFVFLITAYVFSSTKLEERAEQVLTGSEGGWRAEGRGEEMAQTMYVHMNIRIKRKK
jgi:hypothetical protein